MDNKNAKVTNFTPLHQPIQGIVDGQPVCFCAFGDVEGNSPSYQYFDNEGRPRWASFDKVQVTDSHFLGTAALHNLAGAGGRTNR